MEFVKSTDIPPEQLAKIAIDLIGHAIEMLQDAVERIDADEDHDACLKCPIQHLTGTAQDGSEILAPVCYHSCPVHWHWQP